MKVLDLLDSLDLEAASQQAYSTEAKYHSGWQTRTTDLGPYEMAVVGGVAADRFAWVFAAGYQAAIRRVFPQQPFTAWSAFAVSEDRSGKLAPVTWEKIGDDTIELNGYKTWVAACDNLSDVVIKAGRGGNARYFCVPADTPGVNLANNGRAGFLPELSQGRAHFDNARLPITSQLDTQHVPAFATMEVLYIYTAFAAHVYARHVSLRDSCIQALELAQGLSSALADRDTPEFNALDATLQQLLQETASPDADWQRDQKLIQMYSRVNS